MKFNWLCEEEKYRLVILYHYNSFRNRTDASLKWNFRCHWSEENTRSIQFNLVSCKISYDCCSHIMENTFLTLMVFSNLSIHFISLSEWRDRKRYMKKTQQHIKIAHCWIGYLAYCIWITILSRFFRERKCCSDCLYDLISETCFNTIYK